MVLRPRFGRLDGSATPLTRSAAPRLFRLVDDVALAVGARTPHVIAIDETFNAYAVAVGVRRRRVLCLGLPLWAALGPQQRVALLGHELGHFVNGDVRRGLLAQPAFTTLATAADLTRPVDDQSADVVSWFAAKAAQLFQLMISRTLLGLHFVLLSIALRDAQRSEYLADDMAAAVAGSAAATEMLDTLLAIEAVDTVVRRSARVGGGPAQWRAAAAEALANLAPRLPAMRQLSLRDDVSLFMTHPPAGLRARLLDARPQRPPTVVLTAADAQLIDDELDRHYARSRRDIGWSA